MRGWAGTHTAKLHNACMRVCATPRGGSPAAGIGHQAPQYGAANADVNANGRAISASNSRCLTTFHNNPGVDRPGA
jgi:hypothetical protein